MLASMTVLSPLSRKTGSGTNTNLSAEEVVKDIYPPHDGQLRGDLWDHGLCLVLAILEACPLVGKRPDHRCIYSICNCQMAANRDVVPCKLQCLLKPLLHPHSK
eukprot:6445147-Ditylum_brightwellii.AAC.1